MNRRVFLWLLALIGIRPPIMRKDTLADGSWVMCEEIRNTEGQLIDGRIVSIHRVSDKQ